MTYAGADLLAFIEATLWHGFAVFLRVGAMVALMPAFGEASVPTRVTLVVIFEFTFITTPALSLITNRRRRRTESCRLAL